MTNQEFPSKVSNARICVTSEDDTKYFSQNYPTMTYGFATIYRTVRNITIDEHGVYHGEITRKGQKNLKVISFSHPSETTGKLVMFASSSDNWDIKGEVE